MPDAPIPQLLWSEPQAAQSIGVTARTLFGLRTRGEIPHVRIGSRVMYDPRDLAAWIDKTKTTSAKSWTAGAARARPEHEKKMRIAR